jgi:hypothetical protein
MESIKNMNLFYDTGPRNLSLEAGGKIDGW